MPAKLALLACLGLVAAFYVKELKADRASFAPWLVTAWILYCGSRPLETWFASGPVLESAALQASIAGSPLDQAVLTALMVLGLLVLYRRDLPWGDVLRDNGCFPDGVRWTASTRTKARGSL
jgi:hypothetical protein